ncbi:hypothetical protein [Streptomyces sp. NRRL S-1824]|uniref:hypothetical protein n=1 Tax=Streptomyces sp. NRRL S-1824 TaxID=1463889 RepID=UPI0004C49E0B|nr:hypothetical protein [Streptomyces sp. NRRL S-1824]
MSNDETTEQDKADAINRASLIASLRRERLGYTQRGLDKRVAAVDAELKRLGADKEEQAEAAEEAEEAESAQPLETAVESKPRRITGSRSSK